MCKVLIKEVKTTYEPRSGTKNDKPWKLWSFDCLVEVDGVGPAQVRKVKTFESEIANSPMAGKTFEAKKEGEAAPFSFLLQKSKRKGGGHRAAPVQRSDRQVALECASRSCARTSADVQEILVIADEFLVWLEQA